MAFLKDHIKGQVKFEYYRDGNLWYVCETGFKFPVPISDIGNATFHAQDKAMLFMRYIRKHLKTIAQGSALDDAAGMAVGLDDGRPD